jgi:hypothetical protein
MKRYIVDLKSKIVVVMLLGMFSIAILSSCEKSSSPASNSSGGTTQNSSLNGTTWKGSLIVGVDGFEGEYEEIFTLTFFENTVNSKWEMKIEDYSFVDTYMGTYIYEKSKITINMDFDGSKERWTGTVSTNTMTLNMFGEKVTFTKQ